MLGFISRSLNKLKHLDTYKVLYNTYVRSIVDYCSTIWNPYYAVHIGEIERIQRRYTRMIYRKVHYPTKSYETRLLRLDLHSLENRRLLTDKLVLYKIHNGLLHTTLDHAINFNQQTSNVEYFAPMLRL